MLPELSREEILRYSRHLLIPEVGLEGQRKLKGSSALIIGTGGLGSPVSLYLAAAGIGRIGLVDYDVVDEIQFTAPGHPWHIHGWKIESGKRPGQIIGSESRHPGGHL